MLAVLRAIDHLPQLHRVTRVSIGAYAVEPPGWWWSVIAQYELTDREVARDYQAEHDRIKLALIHGDNDWPVPAEATT